MQIEWLDIHGLALIKLKVLRDERGWFAEVWNAREWTQIGIDAHFCQENHSYSRQSGTLRGLHFQRSPKAQAKLIRCTAGRIFDVAVDIRAGSPTFGQWHGVFLSALKSNQFFIPPGFLHGFLTLEPDSEVQYKVDAYYSPESDVTVAWDDPDIGIEWPLSEARVGEPILSSKDASAPRMAEIDTPFRWNEI